MIYILISIIFILLIFYSHLVLSYFISISWHFYYIPFNVGSNIIIISVYLICIPFHSH